MTAFLTLNLSRETVHAVEQEVVWVPREIAANLAGVGAMRHVLRYARVRVRVDDLDGLLSPRPLLAARAMARGDAFLEDAAGRKRPIHWRDLPTILADVAQTAARRRELSRTVETDLAALASARAARQAGGEGVLVVRPDLWFGLKVGGALAHTAGMLNAFAEQGLSVRVLTNIPIDTLSPAITQQIVPRTYKASLAEHSLIAFNRDLIAAAEAAPRPAFVYQRHGLYGYAGALIARRFSVPLVLEHNGSEVWIGDHWGTRVPERGMAERVERLMLAEADVVSVVSAPLISQVVAAGAPPERVLLAPNAVDASLYRPDIDGAVIRAHYGLASDAVVIGFIGTFGRWHGAPVLARVFARLEAPEVWLLMIGDGPERATCERLLADAGASDRAIFTGLVPQAEGAAHMAAADILVTPTLDNPDGSKFFGSPTKLYEYMAMGRAIVASDLAQLADVLKHGQTALLVPPGDDAALAAALTRLCEGAALRARLGAAARADAVAQHQWTHRARLVLDAVARAGD